MFASLMRVLMLMLMLMQMQMMTFHRGTSAAIATSDFGGPLRKCCFIRPCGMKLCRKVQYARSHRPVTNYGAQTGTEYAAGVYHADMHLATSTPSRVQGFIVDGFRSTLNSCAPPAPRAKNGR